MSNLPPLWLTNSQIPEKEVAIVFTVFSLIFLITQYGLYKLSVDRFNTPLSLRNTTGDSEKPQNIFEGVRLTFMGIFLISFSILTTHIMLVITDYGGYFMVGYDSVYTRGPGLILLILGTFRYNKKLYTSNIEDIGSRYLSNVYYFAAGSILIPTVLATSPGIFGTEIIRITVAGYLMIVILTFVLMAGFFYQVKDFTDKLVNFRRGMTSLVMLLINAYILLQFLFIPKPGASEDQYLTRNAELEYLLFGELILLLIIAVVYYATVTPPRWLRTLSKIEEDSYILDMYHFHGQETEKTMIVELDASVEERTSTTSTLLFHQLNPEEQAPLIKQIDEKGMEYRFFDLRYAQRPILELALKKSNAVIMIDELDDLTDNLLEILDADYGWNIEFENPNFVINDTPFLKNGNSYGLLAMMPNPWNNSKSIVLMISPTEFRYPLFEYYCKFRDFIYSLGNLYVKMLIFTTDEEGNSHITSSEEFPSKPAEDSYYLL